jgi:hypothetical protein
MQWRCCLQWEVPQRCFSATGGCGDGAQSFRMARTVPATAPLTCPVRAHGEEACTAALLSYPCSSGGTALPLPCISASPELRLREPRPAAGGSKLHWQEGIGRRMSAVTACLRCLQRRPGQSRMGRRDAGLLTSARASVLLEAAA